MMLFGLEACSPLAPLADLSSAINGPTALVHDLADGTASAEAAITVPRPTKALSNAPIVRFGDPGNIGLRPSIPGR